VYNVHPVHPVATAMKKYYGKSQRNMLKHSYLGKWSDSVQQTFLVGGKIEGLGSTCDMFITEWAAFDYDKSIGIKDFEDEKLNECIACALVEMLDFDLWDLNDSLFVDSGVSVDGHI